MGVMDKVMAAKRNPKKPVKPLAPNAWNAAKAAENKSTGVTKPLSTVTLKTQSVPVRAGESKVPISPKEMATLDARNKALVGTTPGAFLYGVSQGMAAPVKGIGTLFGAKETPEEKAYAAIAASRKLTSQMDASKGMGAPNMITGHSVTAEGAGKLAGSLLPFAAAEQATAKGLGMVLPKLSQPVSRVINGAVSGSAVQGLQEYGEGKRGKELAVSVAQGAALGIGADIGLGYLGKALRNIKAGQKTADVVADIAKAEPTVKASIEKELGIPEGTSWAEFEQRLQREADAEDYYRQMEEQFTPKPVEKAAALSPKRASVNKAEVKHVAPHLTAERGAIIEANGKRYKIIDDDGDNFVTVSMETGKHQSIPKAAAEHFTIKGKAPKTLDIAERDNINVGSQKVKAFQHENPEFKPYFQDMAKQTLNDLNDSIKGHKLFIGEVGQVHDSVTGVSRQTSSTIENILEGARTNGATNKKGNSMSYDTLRKGLKDIIKDNGAENNAVAKRIELYLHDALEEGYRTVDGVNVPPDGEYLAMRGMMNKPPLTPPTPKSAAQGERWASLDMDNPQGASTTLDMPDGTEPNLMPGQKQSKLFTNTLPKSDIFTGQELDDLNIEFEGGYSPKANEETLANARARIEKNGAQKEFEALSQKESFTSDDFVTSMEILRDTALEEARRTGDYSKVMPMLEVIRKAGSTEAGRVVQAHKMYAKTPEGMITLARKVVDNVNAKGKKQMDLTPDDIATIDKSMTDYANLPPGREKDAALAKAKKIIADKIPPTFIDKFRSLQRISWLLNPKTLLTRNPLGNVILHGAEGIKSLPATGIDYLVSLRTGKRTTTIAGGYGKGFKKGFNEQILDWKTGVDTSPTGGQAEIGKGRVWENETMHKLESTVNNLLKLGDRPFYEAAFETRMNQLKKLNKTDAVTDAMTEDAKLYALEQTLQKDSEIAKAFSKLKRISDNPAYQVFANTLLPFTKTPANILDKMFEYSPGGFIKAMTQIGKKGDAFNQKYFVDNLGRAVTGTGLMALGYVGAKNGFITGKPDKDKEVAAVERLIGMQPYAFVTGNGSYTFDWAQPISALLAVGADAYYGGKSKESFMEQLYGSAESAGNTFLNLSMLQGITRAFGGYSPALGLAKSTVEGVAGIASPTLLGQITRVSDPTVRETGGKLIPKMMAKTPGASTLLPAKVDLFGREIKQSEGRGVAARAAENFLSPGYYTSGKTSTPALKEAYRVYKATDEHNVFPKLAPDSFSVKKKPVKLDTEMKIEFQKLMGDMNLKEMEQMIKSASYQSASDDDKAKMLKNLIDDNYEAAKKQFVSKYQAKIK